MATGPPWYEVRTSRKLRRCDGFQPECSGPIEVGDTYVMAKAPPDHDGLGNQGWWVLRFCVPCAEFYNGTKEALAQAS